MGRKVIQISQSTGNDEWHCSALCDDGTMWDINNIDEDWVQLPDIPQE